MALLGYARVSIAHQSLDRELGALNAHGCERIFTDKMSGANDDHPHLAALLDYDLRRARGVGRSTLYRAGADAEVAS
jgi:hypothetical protein